MNQMVEVSEQQMLGQDFPLIKIIYGLIGTLGPELQSSAKVRNLYLNLIIELRNDEEQMVVVESIRCYNILSCLRSNLSIYLDWWHFYNFN